MAKKRAKRAALPDRWTRLTTLVVEYGQACRADEMKGGGDPEDIPIIEMELELCRLKIEQHISSMYQYYESKGQ